MRLIESVAILIILIVSPAALQKIDEFNPPYFEFNEDRLVVFRSTPDGVYRMAVERDRKVYNFTIYVNDPPTPSFQRHSAVRILQRPFWMKNLKNKEEVDHLTGVISAVTGFENVKITDFDADILKFYKGSSSGQHLQVKDRCYDELLGPQMARFIGKFDFQLSQVERGILSDLNLDTCPYDLERAEDWDLPGTVELPIDFDNPIIRVRLRQPIYAVREGYVKPPKPRLTYAEMITLGVAAYGAVLTLTSLGWTLIRINKVRKVVKKKKMGIN